MKKFSLLCLALWAAACAAPPPDEPVHAPTVHAQPEASQAHEHHFRRPADLREYLADLDAPERDGYQMPVEVIRALALAPGMAIADLGAGSGYFTRRFVRALDGIGSIYALDVEPEMLDYVRVSLEGKPGASAVTLVLTRPDTLDLPPQSVDLVFVCNVYHHLNRRAAYFRQARGALRQGGRIAIIDFYHDHRSGDVGFPRRHLVARDTVIHEMTQAGYKLIREHRFLPRQYFLEFSPADF